MRHHRTDLVLATGSRPMVLAAYSSGKPTYAVGPGNTPAYVHASVADPDFAAGCVMAAKIFDWGTACASEQSAIVDRAVAPALRAAMERRGARFLDEREQALLTEMVFPNGPRAAANVDIVGQSPATLAYLAGFSVPETTSLLVVRPGGIGYDHPLSRELLCPIFKWLEVDGPDEGIPTACAQSRFGGDGHTSAVHAADEGVIARFANEIPAYRVCVNTAGLYGAMGHSTGFDPSFMLGTGTIGGSISSDNIGPRHLLNIKRVGAQIRSWEEPTVIPEEGRIAPWALERATASGGAPAAAGPAAAAGAELSLEELVRRAVEEVMSGA
jgi:acetaldehyde dehydrogenase (acetylating)